ncbi:IscS subfamily cysteine desulfurase [Bacillus salitolerans]|uniref:IscS subfamily cysteine desulfurase n=1 Tax=Bacillus salitolerans TaxID=1437434 RepID=A0ABW4LLJ8_9BACI
MIYLDYAATTPMREEAIHVFSEASRNYYGNPSSLHDIGTKANNLLESCRLEIAQSISGDPKGVFFTSGGSESNILAIRSLLNGKNQKNGAHLITTSIEHSSIFNLFKQLEKEGYLVTYLPVNHFGHISLTDLENAISENTVLASIHHANSEIGTIQPIEEIGKLLKKHGILFHSDCVQTYGKVPIDCTSSQIDSLSISSHKIYGPKGVGACYISPKVKWNSYFENTTHEKGFRPGTVNVPGIASFITATQLIHKEMKDDFKRYTQLREMLVDGLSKFSRRIQIEGHSDSVLPHIIGLSIEGIEGQYTMLECNRHGIAISTGSACSVGKQAPSKTMVAIGKSSPDAKQFIRLSLGKQTTKEDIYKTIDVLEIITSSY